MKQLKTILLYKQRKAIAMIELIFAIVILGIVLLSAPMLISTSSRSVDVTFQQESIAILSSHANAMMSFPWDENNTKNTPGESFILSTQSTQTELRDRNSTFVPVQQTRIVAATGALYAATPIANFGENIDRNTTGSIEAFPDDIDDFHNKTFTMLVIVDPVPGSNTADIGEYMDTNISISTQVSYANDFPSLSYLQCDTGADGCTYSQPFSSAMNTTNTSNIKRITSTLTSFNDAAKTITLNSFMCNIGSYKTITRRNK